MFNWSELFALLILVAIAVYWSKGMHSKEMARAAGRQACAGIAAQFLDDTVVLTRTRLRRNAAGVLALHREYRFEYTVNGAIREHGRVNVHGNQVTKLKLESGSRQYLQ